MQPDFVVAGGQRCGTTSIFQALAAHPQIVRPAVDKGTDYYTLHYPRGEAWYRSRFPLQRAATLRTRRIGAPVAFEACTYYMFHPFAIERMARDLPDIKLVVMLRDPVERAFSAYKHEVARGFEPVHDFVSALELEDERVDGEQERLRDPHYASHAWRHQAYRRRGQFAEQLNRIYAHYPRDKVHVMESEAFFAAPAHKYEALTDFLGLHRWQPPSFDQHNARPSKPMPAQAQQFLAAHYRTHDEELAELLGRTPRWAKD